MSGAVWKSFPFFYEVANLEKTPVTALQNPFVTTNSKGRRKALQMQVGAEGILASESREVSSPPKSHFLLTCIPDDMKDILA